MEESLEYVPINNIQEEGNQFLIVHNNNTFILNREVQYVEDIKEVLQDVPTQYFVESENSSQISISNHFMTQDGCNIYTSGYLLQETSINTDKTSKGEQSVTNLQNYEILNGLDKNEEEKLTEVNEEQQTSNFQDYAVLTDVDNKDNFTEVTLTDEQCKTFEQKGWLLLQSNDKVFLLDTLGLHDVTNNENLIEKIKNAANAFQKANIGTVKINQSGSIEETNFNSRQHNVKLGDTLENADITIIEETNTVQIDVNKQNSPPQIINFTQNASQNTDHTECTVVGNTVKLKTSLIFKDIPESIVLGKTINGKKLVAKLLKGAKKHSTSVNEKGAVKDQENTTKRFKPTTNLHNDAVLDPKELENLIQEALLAPKPKYETKDIAFAKNIIFQLLMPTFSQSLIDRNLLITKVTRTLDASGGTVSESKPSLITGRIKNFTEEALFISVPNMLQSIYSFGKQIGGDVNMNMIQYIYDNVLHLHIFETLHSDGVTRTFVSLNKKNVPTKTTRVAKRQFFTSYGCSACAAVFNTEDKLKEHQTTRCFEVGTPSDQEAVDDTETSFKIDTNIMYNCTKCDAKFEKLNRYNKHMKIHMETDEDKSDTEKSTTEEVATVEKKLYKCKMCPSSYTFPSTLTKHIVSKHIRKKM